MVNRAYDRSRFLTISNRSYTSFMDSFLGRLLTEDCGKGDITTDTLVGSGKAGAVIEAKEDGVLAGAEEFVWFCRKNGIAVKTMKKDGEPFGIGDRLFGISGPERKIFYLERTGLNLLQRMSGIAAETHALAKKAAENRCRITATRKTPWGYLDKKAVTVGGGLSHRLNLSESFLIKDNHIDSLREGGVQDPVEFSLDKAWEKRNKSIFIEIEVRSEKEAVRAAEKFKELQKGSGDKKPCIIMLDNMSPSSVSGAVKELREKSLYDHVLLEISGGIDSSNIAGYSKAGADVCSVGHLTHSPRAADISQKFI